MDPDPAFLAEYRSGSRVLMTKNCKNFTAENFFFFFFASKTSIYLSLGLHKGRPSYRRNLQPSKANIQHLKHEISTFVSNFCPPGSGSGFRIRIWIHWPYWTGSNPDPNPKHWEENKKLPCSLFHQTGRGTGAVRWWLWLPCSPDW